MEGGFTHVLQRSLQSLFMAKCYLVKTALVKYLLTWFSL